MLSSAVVLCIVGFYLQESALGCELPNYNVSLTNVKNEDGDWYSKVKLDHDKERPVEFTLTHSSDDSKCTEEIVISLSRKKQDALGSSQHTNPVQESTLLNATRPEQEANNTSIPQGYTLIEGLGYYKLSTHGKTWAEAKEKCEDDGAHLLVLSSENEANQMQKLASFPGYNYVWVGVSDRDRNEKYVTIFGEPLEDTGYSKWKPGEPSGSGMHCVYVVIRNYRWVDD